MQLSNRLFFEQVEAMIAEGHEVQIGIRGNSMRPLLRDGRDTVVLAPCTDTSSLRRGDIVLFRHGGRHVLHRIVQIERTDSSAGFRTDSPTLRFTLAGDGNYRTQEHCTGVDIVAHTASVIRPSGRVVGCRSRRWRWQSRCWLVLPQIVRRVILSAMWRLGHS